MYKTQEQKDTYIEKLFSDVELFEWDVLHVSSNTDRVEVMEILAESLVQEVLKKEINFLYIHTMDRLRFKNIKGEIFKLIINEWLIFCEDILLYPKEKAISIVKEGTGVKFIFSIVNSYFDKYQRLIYSEMVDTFLELFKNVPITKNRQILIEKVLQSDLNDGKDTMTLHKYSQLYNRVRIAQDKKMLELKKLNFKVKELMSELNENDDIAFDKDNEILLDIEDYEYDIEELENTGLYEFDEVIALLRNNMIDAMIRKNS